MEIGKTQRYSKKLWASLALSSAFVSALVLNTSVNKAQAATQPDANNQVTVTAGDTYTGIAAQYNLSLDELQQANPNPAQGYDLIFVGEKITLPSSQNQTVSQPATQEQVEQQQAEQQSVQEQPVAPVQQPVQAEAPVQGTAQVSDAKSWIASRESGGSYSAQNGRYVGKYQLDAAYLNGDYSPANQERVADSYVASRYGSWDNAKAHWLANGWY